MFGVPSSMLCLLQTNDTSERVARRECMWVWEWKEVRKAEEKGSIKREVIDRERSEITQGDRAQRLDYERTLSFILYITHRILVFYQPSVIFETHLEQTWFAQWRLPEIFCFLYNIRKFSFSLCTNIYCWGFFLIWQRQCYWCTEVIVNDFCPTVGFLNFETPICSY